MRFTFSVFSFLLLLGLQACKNDAANQQVVSDDSGKKPEPGKQEQPVKIDNDQVAKTSNVIETLSAEDFDQYIQNNPNTPLIDLRTPEEYNKAHIAHAINIPYVSEGFEDKIKHLQGAYNVSIYCASGMRSKRAALALEKIHVKKIRMLDQGIYSWAVAHKMQVRSQPGAKNK
jgi:rhodanese-related sulfurtransferase